MKEPHDINIFDLWDSPAARRLATHLQQGAECQCTIEERRLRTRVSTRPSLESRSLLMLAQTVEMR